MSDEANQNDEGAENTAPRTRSRTKTEVEFYEATLIRGANYAARHKGKIYRFKKGGPSVRVPASLKEHFEASAVDSLTVTHGDEGTENITRAKFEFAPVA